PAPRAGGRPYADTDRGGRRRPGTPPERARGELRPAARRPCAPDAPRRARSSAGDRSAPSPPARARRDRRAADRTRRRKDLLPFERLFAHLDLVSLARAGRLEDRLELRRVGRPTGDAEAAVGLEHAIRASRRLWAIDEVVDELRLLGQRNDRLLGNELEERALQVVDARAGRGGHAQHTHDALVLDVECGGIRTEVGLVEEDDLRARVEPGAVRGELGVDRAPALIGIA